MSNRVQRVHVPLLPTNITERFTPTARSCPNHQHHPKGHHPRHPQGYINGVSQSAVALVRASAPLFGGAIWDWSMHRTHLPFHYGVPYVAMGLAALPLMLLSWTLPERLVELYVEGG
jgi:hypothetical protein